MFICDKCNAELEPNAKFCTACGARVSKNQSKKVRPWVRFWARVFDTWLFSSFIFVALLAVVVTNAIDLDPWIGTQYAGLVAGFVTIVILITVEAIFLSTIGTTPGKSLLKIKLTTSDGTKLDFWEAIGRTISVWWRGLAMGIPVISLATQVVAYSYLTKNGTTSWDEECGFVVKHEKVGIVRMLVVMLFVAAFLTAFYLLSIIPKTNYGNRYTHSKQQRSAKQIRHIARENTSEKRWVRRGDTVIDRKLNLQWQDDARAATVKRNWYDAKTYCQNLTLSGYSDWRLPSNDELLSIVDKNKTPTIIDGFRNTVSDGFWSSTTYAGNASHAWHVHFFYGYQDDIYKGISYYYVRCVRAGQ